jgi:hypothetical protein
LMLPDAVVVCRELLSRSRRPTGDGGAAVGRVRVIRRGVVLLFV